MVIPFKPLENEFGDGAPSGAVALFASSHELTLLLSDGKSCRSEAVPGWWSPYAYSGYRSHPETLDAIRRKNVRVGKRSPYYVRFRSWNIEAVAEAWFEVLVSSWKSSSAEVSYVSQAGTKKKTGVFVCDSEKTARTVSGYLSHAGTFAKISGRQDSASGERPSSNPYRPVLFSLPEWVSESPWFPVHRNGRPWLAEEGCRTREIKAWHVLFASCSNPTAFPTTERS